MCGADEQPKLVRVKATRVTPTGIEGLVELSDGTEEWRPPSKVTATAVVTRADGTVERTDLTIGGE